MKVNGIDNLEATVIDSPVFSGTDIISPPTPHPFSLHPLIGDSWSKKT